MKFNVTAEHVDTCLPCYLQDGHNREGELLLLCTPWGQTIPQAAQEMMESESCWDGFPGEEEISERQILSALWSALEGVDLRYIDLEGERCEEDPEPEGHADDCAIHSLGGLVAGDHRKPECDCGYADWQGAESSYVYVVLRWEELV